LGGDKVKRKSRKSQKTRLFSHFRNETLPNFWLRYPETSESGVFNFSAKS
jgi:hypothetical protein